MPLSAGTTLRHFDVRQITNVLLVSLSPSLFPTFPPFLRRSDAVESAAAGTASVYLQPRDGDRSFKLSGEGQGDFLSEVGVEGGGAGVRSLKGEDFETLV